MRLGKGGDGAPEGGREEPVSSLPPRDGIAAVFGIVFLGFTVYTFWNCFQGKLG